MQINKPHKCSVCNVPLHEPLKKELNNICGHCDLWMYAVYTKNNALQKQIISKLRGK